MGIQYQFTRGGSSYYAVDGLPKLVPGLPKQHSAPRTPLLLAYPKFARPFDQPTQMKIPRTAPVVSIGQPRQNTDCKGKVLDNRGSKQSGEGSVLDPDLSVRFLTTGIAVILISFIVEHTGSVLLRSDLPASFILQQASRTSFTNRH